MRNHPQDCVFSLHSRTHTHNTGAHIGRSTHRQGNTPQEHTLTGAHTDRRTHGQERTQTGAHIDRSTHIPGALIDRSTR